MDRRVDKGQEAIIKLLGSIEENTRNGGGGGGSSVTPITEITEDNIQEAILQAKSIVVSKGLDVTNPSDNTEYVAFYAYINNVLVPIPVIYLKDFIPYVPTIEVTYLYEIETLGGADVSFFNAHGETIEYDGNTYDSEFYVEVKNAVGISLDIIVDSVLLSIGTDEGAYTQYNAISDTYNYCVYLGQSEA